MTLPASGTITVTQILTELGDSFPVTIPNARWRALAGKPAGSLVIPTDFHGKKWLVVFGTVRTGGESGTPNITIPSVDVAEPISVGDLSILCDVAVNNTTDIPTAVTPSGWNNVINVTGSDALGNGIRLMVSVRILTAGQPGSTIQGMNGTDVNRKVMMTFRMSQPISSVTAGGSLSGITSVDPGNLTILSGAASGNVLVTGFAFSEGSISDGNFVFAPANGSSYVNPADPLDPIGIASATRAGYNFYQASEAKANLSLGMADLGRFNVLAGMYWTLT